MHNLNYKILIFMVALMSFSCASKNIKTQNGNNEVYLRLCQGIMGFIDKEEYEVAYNRMNQSYKDIESFSDFEHLVKEFYGGSKAIAYKYSIPMQKNSYYIHVNIQIDFLLETKFCSFIFGKTILYPLDIKFSAYNDIESKDFPLKDLCEDYFKLGFGMTGATVQQSALRYPEFLEIAKKHFNSCTSTNLMKPVYILDQKKSLENLKNNKSDAALDFSAIIPTLQWCSKNNIKLRGHTLVWHTQTPRWFFTQDFTDSGKLVSREVMISRLDAFIFQYMDFVQTNYPETVYCWDVVNEAVDLSMGDKESFFRCRIVNDNYENFWYSTIGKDYPEVAFTIARKYAASGVKLFYNDYGTTNPQKRTYIYELCKDLSSKKLIDGIGMQAYWDINNLSIKNIKETINKYAELGLEIQLTEWSMGMKEETAENFELQAEAYANIFRLLRRLDSDGGGKANITCVSFFGLMDHYALSQNDSNNTRLWDKNLHPKPVFFSVQDTLNSLYK